MSSISALHIPITFLVYAIHAYFISLQLQLFFQSCVIKQDIKFVKKSDTLPTNQGLFTLVPNLGIICCKLYRSSNTFFFFLHTLPGRLN